jgi:DNA topoisomerase IA
LKHLADHGLTAGCVLANLHHRRIVPLMERRLRIFEMDEDADPVALAESRLLRDPFSQEYAATRARRAIDLRTGVVITRPCGHSPCSQSANW